MAFRKACATIAFVVHNQVRKTLRGTQLSAAYRRVPFQQAHLRPGLWRHRRCHPGVRCHAELALRGDVNSNIGSGHRVGLCSPSGPRRLVSKEVVFDRGGFRYHGRVRHRRRRPRGGLKCIGFRGRNRRDNPRDGGEGLRESRVINIIESPGRQGGRRFSFTALVVIGDGAGQVGLGWQGQGSAAGHQGTEEARRNLFTVPMAGTTIVHETIGELGAGRMLKPAAPGTGVIASGAAHAPSFEENQRRRRAVQVAPVRPATSTWPVRPSKVSRVSVVGRVARLQNGLDPRFLRCAVDGLPGGGKRWRAQARLRRGGLIALKVTQLKEQHRLQAQAAGTLRALDAVASAVPTPAGPSRDPWHDRPGPAPRVGVEEVED